jgi:hypothetical protein
MLLTRFRDNLWFGLYLLFHIVNDLTTPKGGWGPMPIRSGLVVEAGVLTLEWKPIS